MMENKLIQQFLEESREHGVIGAVSRINALYIARSGDDSINMKEVTEFAEYLRDKVFNEKEKFSAMMENWGQDPYIMRLAGVQTKRPLSIVEPVELPEEDPDDFEEDETNDDIDEELSEGDLIDKNAERLFKKIFFLVGDMRLTLLCSDGSGCRMEISEEMKGLMADTVISFLSNFIFASGSLVLNVQNREDGSCSVYGFRSDGLDWFPLTKMEMKVEELATKILRV